MKTAVLHTRMTPRLKDSAESVFERIGLSSSDAIRIFFTQVVLHKGLPFNVSIPNKKTAEALKKSDRNIDFKTFASPDEAFAEWDNL